MGIDHSSHGILTIDLVPEPEMGAELETAVNLMHCGGDCDVVIDFSSADIVTSSSLSKLLKLRKQVGDCGHRLVLCNVATATKGIFSITGLDGVFEFTDDKSAALASIKHTQQIESVV